MFEVLYDALHRELDKIAQKYDDGNELTAQDLEHIDKMAHALKCIATYEAMRGEDTRPRKRYYGRY